ncbi:MAG: bifunctional N-acetylglucosamine-1-phosphate uridyltransferase/glucosamine-1-phosphate acetyltransferase [Desulfobulbaceae bacterium]|nr:MAG: bifunctional N-acetylglucosamine-1-phosphate uridyltransferase/glucosamine-1-phosphate acetyltransferase [Desulfobulbaceae bacterium]
MAKAEPLAAIVLAAGKGTRMKSSLAKVLHHVFFKPMVMHVLEAIEPLQCDLKIAIVGHQRTAVEQTLEGTGAVCVYQAEQNGTGHAVLCAERALENFSGNIIILCGDSPLLLPQHLAEMIESHRRSGSMLTIITTKLDDPTNYGRIISDEAGLVKEVVEEKDASIEQKKISEINAGIYCARKEFLFEALSKITTDNAQGEMYLTDIVGIAVKSGLAVNKYIHPEPSHVLGVNSRVELAQAHHTIRHRRNLELMNAGTTLENPQTTTIGPQVQLGENCTIGQNVTISGTSQLADNCIIHAGAFLNNVELGDSVTIGPNAVVEECHLKGGSTVAPLSHMKRSDST